MICRPSGWRPPPAPGAPLMASLSVTAGKSGRQDPHVDNRASCGQPKDSGPDSKESGPDVVQKETYWGRPSFAGKGGQAIKPPRASRTLVAIAICCSRVASFGYAAYWPPPLASHV